MNEKLKSRKLIFTVIWNAFFLGAMVSDAFGKTTGLASQILPWTGGITVGYISVQGLVDGVKAKK